jgi:CRP/FNR family transcriptional regulator, cyclic AMP receptor protein
VELISELLEGVPALWPLEPGHRETIAGCGSNRVFEAGEYILREGEPADTFYVIRRGDVAIETFGPREGPVTIETIHEGDLLGWSWLVPPYRTTFDARALTQTHAIAFDGACLRGKLDADPALGYVLLRLFAAVIVERLQGTRLRLLDVYGKSSGEPRGAG